MALVVNDRVKETSTTTGTGTFSLGGAVQGFETFVSGIGNSNTTYYSIVNSNGEFEVGIGTITDAATDTLSRDTIISSSNSDSAVNFSAGTKDVFCTLPASKAVILDSSGNIVANNGSNLTALNATQLTSGTVPDARFPATLPALNGSALTALNASNVASGTLSSDRLPTVPTTKGGTGLTAIGTANQVLAVNAGATALEFQTPEVGDITAVTAGSGLTGGGTTGDVTLNVGAGTGVTVNADDIAIGQDVATSASPTFAGLTATGNINLGDSDIINLGASNDLQILHNTSGSFIKDAGASNLFIDTDGNAIELTSGNTAESMGRFVKDGAVELYYDNSKKFETKSDGIDITGTIYADGLSMNDNEFIYLGNSADLRIYHEGSHSFIDDAGTGRIYVRGNDGVYIQRYTGEDMIKAIADGAVELYHNNAKKLETVIGGATVTGTMTATTFSGSGASLTSIPNSALDNSAITINGTSTSLGGSINVGDITGVTAGSGLTGGGTTGAVTLNVGAGTGIDVAADSIAVDVSDFMTNGSNNRVLTATGTDAMNAEANMTFDGSTLAVTGAITATGDVTAFSTSDKSLKKNVVNIDSALDKVSQINGVYYDWTEEALEKNKHLKAEKEVGVIAQDVEKVLPEIVATREDGTKAVKYERLCALLIESVKELKQEIELLKNPGA